jgi:phosphoribosylanthranilate isomerase
MIPVKICGITNVGDALTAVDSGASAIGLVFWPSSPRCVAVQTARRIVQALPPFVAAIGVFVNQMESVQAIVGEVGLSAVQLHGDERADQYSDLPIRVIKAVPVTDSATQPAPDAVPTNVTVLLDAHDPVKRGGTGRAIDWSVAAAIARERQAILSGGLNAGNVVDAIRIVQPYGIDVSSGVESAPGRKDAAKLRQLFDVLRHASFEHS